MSVFAAYGVGAGFVVLYGITAAANLRAWRHRMARDPEAPLYLARAAIMLLLIAARTYATVADAVGTVLSMRSIAGLAVAAVFYADAHRPPIRTPQVVATARR